MSDTHALSDGFFAVPAGKIATIVTHLEMRERTNTPVDRSLPDLTLRRVALPATDWYRELYRRVGEDWLWFSRLKLPDAVLSAIIRHPDVVVYALTHSGQDVGLLELDFRVPGECELAFLGVTAPLIGSGAGRFLMSAATAAAWSRPIRRFWVHTCTLDHPRALDFYCRSGFRIIAREVEIADDPRLIGLAPSSAAPHVPLIRPGPPA